ncbi:type II toxin-antitoxin system Phd/YefM family antitoxin [Cellulomonas septica]|uniref:Antitoxin n=1 Tax=Cellulomonas septica TaxID=285080 RepID=A0ABX1K0T6_9CELL|nr:type II toxin-antitoxin system prevent-host-death family antitoxin [Cellulomonas septica]NKY38598.1 type II toxin-antitoxin system prevent-host-death family antitoxin [Cellulomonas septica]
MKTVPLTMLNQHPSQVVKMVEAGETVQVTRHGQPVLRLVPEPTGQDPLAGLEAAGLLAAARSPRRAPRRSGPLMTPEAADAALADLSADAGA